LSYYFIFSVPLQYLHFIANYFIFTLKIQTCSYFLLKMAKCAICAQKIDAKKLKLACNDCSNEFHGSCLSMSKADIDCITADGLVWRCSTCAANRRKSMRLEAEITQGNVTLDDLLTAINEVKETQKSNDSHVNKAYEMLNEKIDENTKMLNEQNKKN